MAGIRHKLEFAFSITIVCPFLKGSFLETFSPTSLNLGEDLGTNTRSGTVLWRSGFKCESQVSSPIIRKPKKDKWHLSGGKINLICAMLWVSGLWNQLPGSALFHRERIGSEEKLLRLGHNHDWNRNVLWRIRNPGCYDVELIEPCIPKNWSGYPHHWWERWV